jgi:hypothetical protein
MSEVFQGELSTLAPVARWTPRFLREIEALGEEIGFAEAIHQTLERANVKVNVDGDFDQLKEHSGGILFAGDHLTRWEFVAVADMVSQMDRSDVVNIAKFYVQRKVYMALGHSAAVNHAAPVYPRILARDRPDFLNYEFMNRLMFKKHLLSFAESDRANTQSLARASALLANDGVVNIHPTGTLGDATTKIWRSGIGRIVRHIPDEAKPDVLVAPYSLDDFPHAHLLGAVATRGFGPFDFPLTLNVRLGTPRTVSEVVGALPQEEQDNPEAITAVLRDHFVSDFASQ